MAVTSIKGDLRNEIIRILKEEIVYQVQDGDNGATLRPDAIRFKNTRAQKSRSFDIRNQLDEKPGLLVCEPLRTNVLTGAGTMGSDEWHYHWLVQLVDQDLWEITGRVATWSKWIEQIISPFMFNCLNGVVTPPKGQVKFSSATGVADVDETMWVRDGDFIAGVEIEVQVFQPRGYIV